jgi:hypothetical protein
MGDKVLTTLRPSDASATGGFLEDVEGDIVESKFEQWDYNGKQPVPVTAIYWKVAYENNNGEAAEAEQRWKVANVKDFVPSKDGLTLLQVGKRETLMQNTNGMALLESVVNAGFPEDDLVNDEGIDASVFTGMRVQFGNEALPKMEGVDTKGKTRIIVVDIISMPGEEKETKGKDKKGKAAAAKKEESGTDLEAEADDFIIGAISEAGGSLPKKKLPTLSFQHFKKHEDRAALVKLVYKDEYLSNGKKPWTFEDGTLSM